MKTLSVPVPDIGKTLACSLVFAGAVGALGLATWFGLRPDTTRASSSYIESTSNSRMPEPRDDWQTTPAAYRESGGNECSQWDVSPAAMEAILQEMVRRGWKPPTQGEALASGFTRGPHVEALMPDEPVRVPYFVRQPPTEALEADANAALPETDPSALTTNPAALPAEKPEVGPPAEPAAQATRPDALN